MQIHVLEHQGEQTVFHLLCDQCRNGILVMMMDGHLGMNSVGITTDLSHADVVKFTQTEPIQIDHVIEVHQWAQQLDWSRALPTLKRAQQKTRVPKRRVRAKKT